MERLHGSVDYFGTPHTSLNEVKARFRAEFINRVDEQIVFRPLSEEDARRILRPMLDAISEELRGEEGGMRREE